MNPQTPHACPTQQMQNFKKTEKQVPCFINILSIGTCVGSDIFSLVGLAPVQAKEQLGTITKEYKRF